MTIEFRFSFFVASALAAASFSTANSALAGDLAVDNLLVATNLSVGGVIQGNGSGLTNISANSLATGTVPVPSLPTNGLWNATALVISNVTLMGNASGLTNLQGTSIAGNSLGTNQAILSQWNNWGDGRYLRQSGGTVQGSLTANSTLVVNGSVGIGTATPAARFSVVGAADVVQSMIRASNIQSTHVMELQESDGTVFGSFGGASIANYNNSGVFNFADKGLAPDGAGTTDYDYGSIITVHADDDWPYLAKFYNDRYSTTIPVFSCLAWNDGRVVQSTESNQPLQFATDGWRNVRMTISGTGNVGIGTNAPAERMHVAGNIRAEGRFVGNGSGLYILQQGDLSMGSFTNGLPQ